MITCRLPEFPFQVCGEQLSNISEGVTSSFAVRLVLQIEVCSELPQEVCDPWCKFSLRSVGVNLLK